MTDPSKNASIKNYRIPQNAAAVRRFIVFCNFYRKFIKKLRRNILMSKKKLLKDKPILHMVRAMQKKPLKP